MSWQQSVERTVTGLGYELVDLERSAGGLLRVTIDRVPGYAYAEPGESVTVDDCERVTRQLQYLLEVENVAYNRLEVSSPGLDRPLKRAADYLRFAGTEVELTLKAPFQGRKKYRGVLQRADAEAGSEPPAPEAADEGWRLVFTEGKVEQALDFALHEVREARLVPVLDFKGRRRQAPQPAADDGEGAAAPDAKTTDERS